MAFLFEVGFGCIILLRDDMDNIIHQPSC